MPDDACSIRPAIASDVPALTALTVELGYVAESSGIAERLAAISRDDAQVVLVASAAGHTVAWMQLQDSLALESGRRVEIIGLVVGASARRHGIGLALIQAAEAWAKSRGAARLVVRSNTQRAESHLFYAAAGFCRTKTQHAYAKAL